MTNILFLGGYENTNKSNIIINNSDVDLNENDKFTSVKNITSKVTYENVYKNVDLQYFVTTTGVKENIILKDSDVQNEFYISYKTKKLTANKLTIIQSHYIIKIIHRCI